MKTFTLSLILLWVVSSEIFSQRCVISGVITDNQTGETLISANVYENSSLRGTISNNYGFYSLILPAGKATIVCSYIGYQTQEIELDLTHNITVDFKLEPVLEIEEVAITDKSPQQTVRSSQMSVLELPVLQAKQLPVLFGEVDIIKSLQLMPGVQSGTEGSTGLYVRGGGPDQNLILLDGVPVYNVNHLFGFFSVFNADAIKSVSLIKGGFPAHYGGRLSSVIDIRMKEGNMKELKGEGSIGLISSKFTLEGPIIKDKTSFIVSGRRTYIDLLSYPLQYALNKKNIDSGEKDYAGFNFYDLNAKVNHIFNPNNRLFLSAYLGKDKFYLKEKSNYNDPTNNYYSQGEGYAGLHWGNATIALRWNHLYNNRLFSNLTLTFSDYTFVTQYEEKENTTTGDEEEHQEVSFEYYSRIRDYALNYDFEYNPLPSHYIRFGINNTVHTFSPGVTVLQQSSETNTSAIDTSFGRKNIPANEFFAYAEDDISIGKRFKINLGFHYSNFYLKDTIYHSIEPRISARYMLTENLSLKASYVRMNQYINLLTNTTIGLPTDLWVPCTRNIYPQKAWQTALGGALGIGDQYEVTLEGFYKKMKNLVEYNEGASFFDLNRNWEELVTQGEGESYGVELFVQKTAGKTSGWIGYTLSWSTRQFEDISYGKKFPYKYDRRHDISVVLTHKFSDRIDIGMTWVFGTGHALTLADERFASHEAVMNNYFSSNESQYYFGDSEFTRYFETRNSFRMPAYHRLDLGINFSKQKPRIKRVWSFGVYNIYARKNPFFIYESQDYDFNTGEIKSVLKQVSILTFVPYFRYSLSF